MLQEAKVLVGPRVHARSERPCPCYFEITFLADSSLGERMVFAGLTFQNYFCSYISIKQLQKSKKMDSPSPMDNSHRNSHMSEEDANNNRWVTILPFRQLMKNAHHETDAQHWHAITVEEFESNYKPLNFPLRIYLNQPSPLWAKIDIKDIKCFMKPVLKNPLMPPSPPIHGSRKGLSFHQQKRAHRTSPRNQEEKIEKKTDDPLTEVIYNIRKQFHVLKGNPQRNQQNAISSGYTI